MISASHIRQLANQHQTTELNINREYIQQLFLAYFYQQLPSQDIYFKGGTALRLAFSSPRFSEDLDFSSSLKDPKPIEDSILDTLTAISREGIDSEITDTKSTTGGYLSQLKFIFGENQLSLELNFSCRQPKLDGEIVTIAGDFLPPFIVNLLSQNQLVQEKLQALLSRQKPRDFFDLYFILRKNLLSLRQKSELKQILPLLHQTKINFGAELKQFLPKSHWPVIKRFKAVLGQEISRAM